MTKPRTQICLPRFSEIDKTLGRLELNFLKLINQNGISDIKFNAKILFVFCKKSNSMIQFVKKPSKPVFFQA